MNRILWSPGCDCQCGPQAGICSDPLTHLPDNCQFTFENIVPIDPANQNIADELEGATVQVIGHPQTAYTYFDEDAGISRCRHRWTFFGDPIPIGNPISYGFDDIQWHFFYWAIEIYDDPRYSEENTVAYANCTATLASTGNILDPALESWHGNTFIQPSYWYSAPFPADGRDFFDAAVAKPIKTTIPESSLWSQTIESGDLRIGTVPVLLPPVPGYVGYWPMDGDATDQSGFGSDGTVTGNASFVPGYIEQAINWTGNAADGVDIPANALAQISGNLTFCCWIYPRTFPNYATIVDSVGRQLALFLSTTASSNWYSVGGAQGGFTLSTSYVLNEWQHVTIVKEGAASRFYRNGIQNGSGIANPVGTVGLSLHRNVSGGGTAWDGMMDEIILYDYALSDQEILDLASV